jgi:hypothetical protein
MEEPVDHGGGDRDIAEDLTPAPERLTGNDDQARSFIGRADQLEEQVGGFGFEGDVANLVDDDEW